MDSIYYNFLRFCFLSSRIYFFLICLAGLSLNPTQSKALSLSQDYVLKRVLSSSPHIQKVKLQKKQAHSALQERRYSSYDTKFFSQVHVLNRDNPLISPFEPEQEKNKTLRFGIEQNLPLGFSVSSFYTDVSRDITNNTFLRQTQAPEFSYRKNLSLEINVDLSRNIFGMQERLASSIIDSGEKVVDWKYLEDAEQLALTAAKQYWKTYISWIIFQQVKKGKKTYSQLVREINNKKKYNFLRPGERPQILAEYENLKQDVLLKEQDYKDNLENLFIMLKLKKKYGKILFSKKPLKSPSAFSLKKTGALRLVKIKKEKLREQEFNLKISRSNLLPSVSLQTKGGWLSGDKSKENYNRFDLPSDKKFYEVGFQFRYPLFSKSAFKRVNLEEYKWKEQKIDFDLFKQEIETQVASLKQRIQIAYKNVKTSAKANRYQKQAFLEIKKSFYQGRTDIFGLITAENKLRQAEIKQATVLSEYSLLTLQLEALLDQLVESYIKKS